MRRLMTMANKLARHTESLFFETFDESTLVIAYCYPVNTFADHHGSYHGYDTFRTFSNELKQFFPSFPIFLGFIV